MGGLTCKVRLTGEYLYRCVVDVRLDGRGRIVWCKQIKNIWTGKPEKAIAHHNWFVDMYRPALFNPASGQVSFIFVQISAPEEIDVKMAA